MKDELPKIGCFVYRILSKRSHRRTMISVFKKDLVNPVRAMEEYRGGEEGTPDMQEWVVWPVDKTKYNLLSCQPAHMDKNECLGIGTDGKLIRWEPTGGAEQQFSFGLVDENGWFEIYADRPGENIAVGLMGEVLRWPRTNGDDQRFKLEIARRPTGKVPEIKNERRYDSGAIPDLPKRTGPDPVPDSPKYLIGDVLTPAFFVKDGRFRSKVTQMLRKPFYRLRREQRWVRIGNTHHSGVRTEKYSFEVTIGMSETHVESMEETTGISLKGDFGVSLASKIDILNFGAPEGEGRGTFGAAFTKELKLTRSTTTTKMKETKETITLELAAGKPCYISPYVLEDIYTVFDADDEVIESWALKDRRYKRDSVYVPPSTEAA